LTHAHFDHAGNADALARHWNVPVLAHPLEMPYLTGESDYPPQDPTVGGAIAAMSRTFPHGGRALRADVRMLSGHALDVPGWRWIHTPGHTAGHLSLFRDADRTLLAGDALTTMDMDSWTEQVRRTPALCRPPAPLTTDWEAARRSVQALAALEPRVVAAGHGLPVAGDDVPDAMRRFAERFAAPAHGRYVIAPAETGPAGVEWLPPAVPDSFPRRATGAALVVIGALGLAAAVRRH
jgi:glyoxylase-like metal-dependent hydrolase (beta-lactamase superfamily II)